MKIIILFASAATLMGAALAPSAHAGTIVNAGIDLTAAEQVGLNVNQSAAAVSLAVGPTNYSNIGATGLNGFEIADISKTLSTDESAGWNGGAGGLSETELNQEVRNLDQTGLAVAGTGALSNSSLTSAMTNVGEDANVAVTITTKH